MKKWTALFALLFFLKGLAQDSTKAVLLTYKTYSSFPAYPLLALDSSKFNSVSISNKKEPVVIIYFSPTCSHCQHQVEEITSHMNEFQHVQFLMVSSYSMKEIKEFSDTYGMSHFSNVTLAHDPVFGMGQFFEIRSLPGIFVYNKKGKLQTHFETNVLADSLSASIKQ
jgi:peroxiredoxin